jgi:hypothetical protein
MNEEQDQKKAERAAAVLEAIDAIFNGRLAKAGTSES